MRSQESHLAVGQIPGSVLPKGLLGDRHRLKEEEVFPKEPEQ